MSNLEGKQKQLATYEPNITAVLCVDHYNDFLSESGKLWPLVKDVAQEVNLLDNLLNIVRMAREFNISIFHVPHHRSEPGDYVTGSIRLLINFREQRTRSLPKALGAENTFHDDFQVQPGDIVATEHWGSSGFPNTDLDHQLKFAMARRKSSSLA